MLLMTPGPTPVLESVRVAMSEPTIHHRTPEFEAIFASARKGLKKLFGMEEVLMLSCSGTGAMEAAVINFTKGHALTINSGKFGERFGKICDAHGIIKTEIVHPWNEPANVEEIKKALADDPLIDAVFIQVCESAGGLRHSVEAIAKEVKAINPDIIMVCDGITAVGVEKIDTTHIDVLISGSQKALMLPPGLAMMGLSTQATQSLETYSRGYYLNLASELKKQRQNTTAYTAATTLIIGLVKVLEEIELQGGLENLYRETKKRAVAMQAALKAIGLHIFPDVPALAMAAVSYDKANELRKILKEQYHVNIAGGQDHLKGKLFRINNMGFVRPSELSWTLNAIEMALEKLENRRYDGMANKTFNKLYKEEV